MVFWSVEISEHDIQYVTRGSIKSKALENISAKFSPPKDDETPSEWTVSDDGASNVNISGARIVLEGPGDTLIKQSLKFEFKASNN